MRPPFAADETLYPHQRALEKNNRWTMLPKVWRFIHPGGANDDPAVSHLCDGPGDRFGVVYHERTVGKLLEALGFSHISAHPRHPAQDARTIEAFKKTSPPP